jgi:hypothetical protein
MISLQGLLLNPDTTRTYRVTMELQLHLNLTSFTLIGTGILPQVGEKISSVSPRNKRSDVRKTIGLQPMELQLQPNKRRVSDTIGLQPMELQLQPNE